MEHLNTTAQKEAILNDHKGALFEFLVASQLWQKLDRQNPDTALLPMQFSQCLLPEQLEELQHQEQWLRRLDVELLTALPLLASAMADKMMHQRHEQLLDVRIIGEMTSGKSQWNEGDLLLRLEHAGVAHWRPVSLKMCKRGAYVNTKSAGIKSFLSKYFSYYFSSRPLQVRQFGQEVDFHFNNMAHQLHHMHGMEFSGHWQDWQARGLATLPGQLGKQEHAVLLHFYYQVAQSLRDHLLQAFTADSGQFMQALAPIMGQGRRDMEQYICFYTHSSERRYVLDRILHYDAEWLHLQIAHAHFMPPKEHTSSFDIQLKDALLQIRMKPMNTFTVPALKVNCSVLYEVHQG